MDIDDEMERTVGHLLHIHIRYEREVEFGDVVLSGSDFGFLQLKLVFVEMAGLRRMIAGQLMDTWN